MIKCILFWQIQITGIRSIIYQEILAGCEKAQADIASAFGNVEIYNHVRTCRRYRLHYSRHLHAHLECIAIRTFLRRIGCVAMRMVRTVAAILTDRIPFEIAHAVLLVQPYHSTYKVIGIFRAKAHRIAGFSFPNLKRNRHSSVSGSCGIQDVQGIF